LVPGLRHVQHHPVLVEGLEGEGGVRADLGREARARIAVGVGGLLVALEFADGNLAEDA
jgi:hypothetical protein